MDKYVDPYFKLAASAEQHDCLYHFTSMESFEKIIKGGKLKLNRLDQMDDKGENEFLLEFWKNRVYACCFTHSNEGKQRFWSEYAKNNGVRIEFPNRLLTQENYQVVSEEGYAFAKIVRTNPNHKVYDNVTDWGVYDISKVDVQYLCPEEREKWRGRSNGLTKNCLTQTSYDWEEETRIRITMKPLGWEMIREKDNCFRTVTPFFKSIFIKLSDELLSNICISVPCEADNSFVHKVRDVLSTNSATKNCAIRRLGA